jgi:hypothetical protein
MDMSKRWNGRWMSDDREMNEEGRCKNVETWWGKAYGGKKMYKNEEGKIVVAGCSNGSWAGTEWEGRCTGKS